MPTSEHGDFENPTKSAYSVERYNSSVGTSIHEETRKR